MDARQTANDQARAFLADVEDALAPAVPTSYRDDTLPAQSTVGTTPPVPQPGRPAMSQRATDASALMLAAGVASVPIGGVASLFVYTLGQVDPTTLAIAAAAPATIALPILALCRLAGRARQVVEAAPPIVHQHYAGPVDQRTVTATARGLVARSRGEMKG
ncbi:hypothetical protein GT030_29660 [Streptomyces sp. SID1328]|uniref:hypothetical protein n=1 Tax=Streptomyces sp. SID1328 TaxID=2690250 RepID=UPI00136E851E|nr:hypothetical protein [Streptomyces sp. SID1328]MYV42921.1 hypothetical protein [Streptomyces sp. SID1328]